MPLLDLDDLLGSRQFFASSSGVGSTQVLQHLALDTGKLVNDLSHVQGCGSCEPWSAIAQVVA